MPSTQNLIASIDRCLPQTQCAQCNYPSCIDYAHAIAIGEADINQCPPGGDVSVAALAKLLGQETKPLNPENGSYQPLRLAFIREDACIGCTLCINACPLDCIIGSGKLMHTVIAEDCSGCALCLPICPTDCIDLIAPPPQYGKSGNASMWVEFSREQVEKASRRARQKRERIAVRKRMREQHRRQRLRGSLKKEIFAAVQRKQNQNSLRDSER